MEFWIFMLVMTLLMPFVMIGFGRRFMRRAPKKSTPYSAIGQKAPCNTGIHGSLRTDIAASCGFFAAIALLALTLIVMPFSINKSEDLIGIAASLILGVQLIGVIATIPSVEIALRKNFDPDGRRR